MTRPRLESRLHHIGVQTSDMANSLNWYRDFFGCREVWTLRQFSELTRSRLPGLKQITEVIVENKRFHLFERARNSGLPDGEAIQFQHLCLAVDSPEQLRSWRSHWLALRQSGKYEFVRSDLPTDIVTDDDGTQSFYCFDVNGLEFEFTFVAGEAGVDK